MFEEASGDMLRREVSAGAVAVEYRMRCMLGAGSVRAYNALALAAEEHRFDQLRTELFRSQPTEGEGEFTTDLLIELGRRAGLVTPRYVDGVRQARYEDWAREVEENFQAEDPGGTPAGFLTAPPSRPRPCTILSRWAPWCGVRRARAVDTPPRRVGGLRQRRPQRRYRKTNAPQSQCTAKPRTSLGRCFPLLAATNVPLARDLASVHDGERLLRVLLVRGKLLTVERLTVADGYHSTWATCELGEDADSRCRLVDLGRQDGGALV
jgi:hypothetical protein